MASGRRVERARRGPARGRQTRPAADRAPGRLGSLPWGRIALATILALVVIGAVPPLRRAAAVVSSKAVLLVLSPLAPDIDSFEELDRGSKVLAADGTELANLGNAQQVEPVPLDALPDHVWRAVLAAEDANFYDHGGVDPSAVFRALLRNAQGGRQGGSTITQQLAKLNYTKSERTFLRKLREVQYAVRLEKEYSKDELLERYLNQVYFGDGAFGLAAASRLYFATDPQGLSVAQAATLAGKIRAPEALDPRSSPDRVQARRDAVLRLMRRNGWLSESELASATAAPLQVAPPSPSTAPGGLAPHFVEYVKREAATIGELGGTAETRATRLLSGGFTVKTTLDPEAFRAAQEAIQAALPDATDPDAAVVGVEPGDGAIRVLVGGRDFRTRNFDLASQGRRQPGSSFKPFVYLAAVAAGIDPRSTFDASSPQEFEYRGERYVVDNYEGKGGGRVDLDTAMAQSINTVFARLVLEVGPAKVARVAERLGVADVDANVGARPAIALGGLRKGVTPLEQAAAFAAFAADGVYARPYAIAEIVDRDGDTVFKRQPDIEAVFNADEVGVLNAALLRVVREGTGKGAAIGRQAAGKTGTTQEYGDAWFVGFTPQLSTAVWVGHPDRIVPMTSVHGRRVTGGSYPAQIWRATMRRALAGVRTEEIHTASPDKLGLRRLGGVPAQTATVPSSTTSSSSSTTTSSVPPGQVTVPTVVPLPAPTLVAPTTTTSPGRDTTTTTTTAPTTTTTAPTTTTSSSTTTTTTTTAPGPGQNL